MTGLSKLTNQDLEFRLKDLVQKERTLLHVILEHINEVDRRRLYLEKAYPSLFEYLVKEMNYSGSAAMRRIEAARLLREVPVLAQKIEDGEVNLSQVGELSRAIKEKERLENAKLCSEKENTPAAPKNKPFKVSAQEKTKLVEKISSQSGAESQKMIAEALDLPTKKRDHERVQKDASRRLEITVSEALYKDLMKCKDQAAHVLIQNHQDTSWESVLRVLAHHYLKKSPPPKPSKKDSQDKGVSKTDYFTQDSSLGDSPAPASASAPHQFQNQTPNSSITTDAVLDCETKAAPEPAPVPVSIPASSPVPDQTSAPASTRDSASAPAPTPVPAPTRVSVKIRREVLQRDQCCQYQDPRTGKKCQSTFALHVDHRQPQWAGGSHDRENLQALCAAHNNHKYRRESLIQQKLR